MGKKCPHTKRNLLAPLIPQHIILGHFLFRSKAVINYHYPTFLLLPFLHQRCVMFFLLFKKQKFRRACGIENMARKRI